jgi:DnaK suppressor protein
MTDEQRSEIKSKIILSMDELETEIKSLIETTKPIAPDVAIGRLTRMEAINAKGISEANLNSAKVRLKRLGNTINRIEQSSFGVCAKCEEEIPIKRMMLLPESTRCVSCTKD